MVEETKEEAKRHSENNLAELLKAEGVDLTDVDFKFFDLKGGETRAQLGKYVDDILDDINFDSFRQEQEKERSRAMTTF